MPNPMRHKAGKWLVPAFGRCRPRFMAEPAKYLVTDTLPD